MHNDEPQEAISLRFYHGLGDCSSFAHAVTLWTKRGYAVEIETSKDKEILFHIAGASTTEKAQHEHGYFHPADLHLRPQFHEVYTGNKIGHNLTQNLPPVGKHEDLWNELLTVKLNLPEPEAKSELEQWLSTMSGKLVVFHPQGNTGQEYKNITHPIQAEFCRELLDQTDATVIVLDWDNRTIRMKNKRVRHLADDFRTLSVLELAYLIERCDLFVGVDSGPLHLTRFINTPAIGVWVKNHPVRFSLPRENTAHLVPNTQPIPNRYHRHTFNLIECGSVVTGQDIAKHATRALEGKTGAQLAIAALVDRVRTGSNTDEYRDRNKTFAVVLQHLSKKKSPQVVETGCIRSEDDWTAGYFTYLVGWFLKEHGGRLDSVDLDGNHVDFAKKWTQDFPVNVHCSDSLKWLEQYEGKKIDVAYLDSLDADQPGHAEHGLREAELVLPHLAKDALVLIDDTPYQKGEYHGKGRLAIPFLLDQGFKIVFGGYQVLLRKP